MSIKQLNRDFATTFPCLTTKGGRTLGAVYKRDLESCIKRSEQMVFNGRDEQDGLPIYADIMAVVTHRRMDAASVRGVRVRSHNVSGVRYAGPGVGYHVALLRFSEKPGNGWSWSCPLSLYHDLDLHWKGLIERDKWQTFIRRLNSVCAEASIFAHAFRHGA